MADQEALDRYNKFRNKFDLMKDALEFIAGQSKIGMVGDENKRFIMDAWREARKESRDFAYIVLLKLETM